MAPKMRIMGWGVARRGMARPVHAAILGEWRACLAQRNRDVSPEVVGLWIRHDFGLRIWESGLKLAI